MYLGLHLILHLDRLQEVEGQVKRRTEGTHHQEVKGHQNALSRGSQDPTNPDEKAVVYQGSVPQVSQLCLLLLAQTN
jgi:hypothetical protein